MTPEDAKLPIAAIESLLDAQDELDRGVCKLHLTGPGGGCWTIDFGRSRQRIRAGDGDAADTLLATTMPDFLAVLRGGGDPVEMFYRGALTVRGDVSLAMRVTDLLWGAL